MAASPVDEDVVNLRTYLVRAIAGICKHVLWLLEEVRVRDQ